MQVCDGKVPERAYIPCVSFSNSLAMLDRKRTWHMELQNYNIKSEFNMAIFIRHTYSFNNCGYIYRQTKKQKLPQTLDMHNFKNSINV